MSHFTTVETKIKDLICLKEALKDLGYNFTEATELQMVEVKGYQKQRVKADMAIHISKTYDVGVRVTERGVEFVADWWGVETTAGITEQEFTQLVTRRYAYHKVKNEIKKLNWKVTEEEQKEDQTVKIYIRSWQ